MSKLKLKQMLDAIINDDYKSAEIAFNEYVTYKSKNIITEAFPKLSRNELFAAIKHYIDASQDPVQKQSWSQELNQLKKEYAVDRSSESSFNVSRKAKELLTRCQETDASKEGDLSGIPLPNSAGLSQRRLRKFVLTDDNFKMGKIVATMTVMHASENGEIYMKLGDIEKSYKRHYLADSYEVTDLTAVQKQMWDYRFGDGTFDDRSQIEPQDADDVHAFEQVYQNFITICNKQPGGQYRLWSVEYDIELTYIVPPIHPSDMVGR